MSLDLLLDFQLPALDLTQLHVYKAQSHYCLWYTLSSSLLSSQHPRPSPREPRTCLPLKSAGFFCLVGLLPKLRSLRVGLLSVTWTLVKTVGSWKAEARGQGG